MKTGTESKRCKSCTHQGKKAMTGKCFTCYDYENYERFVADMRKEAYSDEV